MTGSLALILSTAPVVEMKGPKFPSRRDSHIAKIKIWGRVHRSLGRVPTGGVARR